MLLSNNSYDNHGIHDNIVLPNVTILKISLDIDYRGTLIS